MPLLPIDEIKNSFKESLSKGSVVVEAPTASGKSTRIPDWCQDFGRVLVVEPRRMACRALARYLARLRGTELGQDVGYAVRFESSLSNESRIVFATTGLALRWFARSGLQEFKVIFLDEFHERRADQDLLLAMLKQRKIRLVLASATVQGTALAKYLGAYLLRAESKSYPVQVFYQGTRELPSTFKLAERVSQGVKSVLNQVLDGDVLVFLPGKGEILGAKRDLEGLNLQAEILSLHAGMNPREQDRVLEGSKNRRVVLSTNVAETSLTLPQVKAVVDSGLERRTHHRGGRVVLGLHSISQAAADQRRGRAGRLAPGICLRLWGEQAKLEPYTPAEVQREEVTDLILSAGVCGYRIEDLEFLDPVSKPALDKAKEELQSMGALGGDGLPSEHGKRLFRLPLEPLFAHLISGMQSRETKAMMLDLSSALSVQGRILPEELGTEGEKRLKQFSPEPCDACTLIRLIREDPPEGLPLNRRMLEEARRISQELRKELGINGKEMKWSLPIHRFQNEVLAAAPQLAFIRRVRSKRRNFMGNQGSEVMIAPGSRFPEKSEAGLVFDQHNLPGKKGTRQTLSLATCISPLSIEQLVEQGIGSLELSKTYWENDRIKAVYTLSYADRVIKEEETEPEGQELCRIAADMILKGKLWPEIGRRLNKEIQAYNLYLKLGFAQGKEVDPAEWLTNRLYSLGLDKAEELGLLDEDDFEFSGIPEFEKERFKRNYPEKMHLEELKLRIYYEPKTYTIILEKVAGRRKSAPSRRELPPWGWKWRVRFKDGSRVVEI